MAASELTRVSLAQALLRDVAASRVAVVMTAGDATRVSGTTHIASLDRGRLLVEPRHPADVLELRRRPAR
ncbi:MAG TPA: hypothetical protein VK506_02605 [Conexibacter sp.]|nr:hypothetical protein [Conexibacter sp.]